MSFDRLAPHYRWMEALLAGTLLQRCRTQWLSEVRESRHALLVGEGNGRMLEACAAELPECQFTVMDESNAMLNQARRRWARAGGKQPVRFQRADLRDWRAAEADFDLVITNFFFDCFTSEELSRVIANINIAAAPRSRWLVADFCVPPSGWRKVRSQGLLALAYGCFRVATGIAAKRLVPPDAMLRSIGFALQHRQQFNHGLLHADLWVRG